MADSLYFSNRFLVKNSPALGSGVAVIIGTQLARTLGKVLAKKIAGQLTLRVLSRIGSAAIPLAGWIVGAALIVWDLWTFREGSLPMIQNALQKPEVKVEIQNQVSEQLKDELRLGLPQMARDISNDVYARWQEFRYKYARVLELAETNARFRGLLDITPVAEVKKLADFVAVVEAKLGPDRLENLLERGHFERLLSLPQEMLELGVDPEVVIAWADLAGDLIVQVVSMELYRVASPTDFSDRADLERILALEDAHLIQRVMLLDRLERDALQGLSTAHISQVLDAFSGDDLSWLAREYLFELLPGERNELIDRIIRVPEILPELRVDLVRHDLLEGKNFEATLNYITQRTTEVPWVGKVFRMLAAVGPVTSEQLPWRIFWHYDGSMMLNVIYGLVGLIALYLVWWRVSPRRRQDVNVTVVLPEKRNKREIEKGVRQIEGIDNRDDEE